MRGTNQWNDLHHFSTSLLVCFLGHLTNAIHAVTVSGPPDLASGTFDSFFDFHQITYNTRDTRRTPINLISLHLFSKSSTRDTFLVCFLGHQSNAIYFVKANFSSERSTLLVIWHPRDTWRPPVFFALCSSFQPLPTLSLCPLCHWSAITAIWFTALQLHLRPKMHSCKTTAWVFPLSQPPTTNAVADPEIRLHFVEHHSLGWFWLWWTWSGVSNGHQALTHVGRGCCTTLGFRHHTLLRWSHSEHSAVQCDDYTFYITSLYTGHIMLLHLAVLRSSSPKPGTWYAREQSKHVCSVNVQSNSLSSTNVLLTHYVTVA